MTLVYHVINDTRVIMNNMMWHRPANQYSVEKIQHMPFRHLSVTPIYCPVTLIKCIKCLCMLKRYISSYMELRRPNDVAPVQRERHEDVACRRSE